MMRGLRPDPWMPLKQRTAARIALGRAGGSLPTAELLRFALDHAEARDAVHTPLDVEAVASALRQLGHAVETVQTQVASRDEYLKYPDRGRVLDDESRRQLAGRQDGESDVCLILGDGLSATAVHQHGVALVQALLQRLSPLRVAPLIVAKHARVALQDDIGQAVSARSTIIMLGERPGLGTADSLGAYLVFGPKPGNTDARRNCVSNIRPAGLPIPAAAETIAYLLQTSLQRQISGVQLKDDRVKQLP